MAVIVALCTLLLAALVVWVVSGPLRRAGVIPSWRGGASESSADVGEAGQGGRPGAAAPGGGIERAAELEAAREITYREIRDAELDYRTGKLSEHDYRAIDAELRAQALALLDEIERREQPHDWA